MSQLWTQFKSDLRALIAITLLGLVVCACYEGPHRPDNKGSAAGNGSGSGIGGSASKTYGIAYVDIFRPSPKAFLTPDCGNVPSSLTELRVAEMEAQVKAITSLIEAQSVQIRPTITDLDVNGCSTMIPIESRAETALPDPEVDEPLKSKPALHVRVVLWYGDNNLKTVPYNVWYSEWADMKRLRELGFARRISVNYFAQNGSKPGGYVYTWQKFSDPNYNFNASTVSDPAPTDQGVADVLSNARNNTAKFADWLHQRASGS